MKLNEYEIEMILNIINNSTSMSNSINELLHNSFPMLEKDQVKLRHDWYMMRRKLLLLNLLCWCSQISITYGQNLDSLILLSDDDSISYNERLASIGKVIKVYKQDFHFKYFPKLLSFEPIVGKCFSTEAQIEYYSKLYFYYLTSYSCFHQKLLQIFDLLVHSLC